MVVYLSTPLFLGLAGLLAWQNSHNFKAATILSAVVNTPGGSQGGGLSALASQFSGLASLAGLSTGEESKKWESIAVLQSESLTKSYIKTKDLIPILYASKWDAARGQWKDPDPSKIPTLWQADQMFKRKVLAVTIDSKTNLVTLTITWKNPKTAAEWANGLVAATNDYLRDRAIVESERNIEYLTDQAQRSTIVEVKQAVFSILQSEITKEMLARGNDEYAFKVIDPASAPEKPSTLPLAAWFGLGLFASLTFSLLVAFVRIALIN